MVDIWTATADKSLNDPVTFTEWNNLVGAGGNLDYLYNRGWRLHGQDTTERTSTSTSATDLSTVSGLSITVAQPVLLLVPFRKSSGAAAAVGFGLKVNSTTVIEAATANALGNSSATNQAEDGLMVIFITPRSANYLTGIVGMFSCRVTSTGANAVAAVLAPNASSTFAAVIPNATITSLAIRGISGSGSVTMAVDEVSVYAGGVTL